jgi:uncharacterized protein (DUF58 family)
VSRAAAALTVGVMLCLAAGGFGAPPLYVSGIALLLIAGAASAWVRLAARGARVVRSVGLAVVEEQAALPLAVSVVHGRVPLPGSELRPWPGSSVLPVPGAGDRTVTTVACFPRRGLHRLGPASLVIADPLGLCTSTVASDPNELLVLPRVEPVRMAEVGGEAKALASQLISTAEVGASDIDSLRAHRPGTPASRIHWPTVARTRTLMERNPVADYERAPVVVVDPRDPSSEEALDQAVRAAASLCVHLARHGGCALLLPGDRAPAQIDPALRAFSQVHARLAVLGPGAGAPPIGAVLDATMVLWVTAAQDRVKPLGALRAKARYLVSPHPQARWPVQFTVAGCSGQRIEVEAAAGTPTRSPE